MNKTALYTIAIETYGRQNIAPNNIFPLFMTYKIIYSTIFLHFQHNSLSLRYMIGRKPFIDFSAQCAKLANEVIRPG